MSRITKFVLLDPNGNDVTEGCGITVNLHEGEIVISKYHSSIYLYAISKPYDGQPVVYEDGDYEYENLPDGYEIEFELESMVNAGVYNAEDIELVSYTVYDNGENYIKWCIFDGFWNWKCSTLSGSASICILDEVQ